MMFFAPFIVLNIFIITTNTHSTEIFQDTEKMNHKILSVSCNTFAEDFHKRVVTSTGENVITSSLNIHMILSLLSHGAESETLTEFINRLYHRQSKLIKEQYTSLISILNELENVKLYIANGMYVQEGFELLTDFVATGTDAYRSNISKLNFKHNVNAARAINNWVKQSTNNKITDLISSDDIQKDTKLLLVSVIYFTGKWLHKFDPRYTERKIFYLTKQLKTLVPIMYNRSKYTFGVIPSLDSTFIEIPYMNQNVVMTIILPNQLDGLTNLETKFTWEILTKTTKSFGDVDLYLPKFKAEFMVDLKMVLSKLGLNKIFEDTADFRRISNVPLKVNKLLHKAMVEVTEEGTEAAAATAVHMRPRRMAELPEQFVVDRPFMFVIEYKPSNIPLFTGYIRNLNHLPKKDEL